MKEKRRVLFYRSWTRFNGGTSGGQLKVRDAFEHFKTSDRFEPFVYFGEETVWYDNPGNYWLPYRESALKEWEIRPTDILFFSGHDWKVLPKKVAASPPVPILNITQPRQAFYLKDRRHEALKNPAIRIAKSSYGKKILEDYGVNGPVYLIPDSIDFSKLPPPNPSPDLDLLIVGLKNEGLAKQLARKLKFKNFFRPGKWKIGVQLPPKLPTRTDFLNLVNRAKIVVFLPLNMDKGGEGFYLPALEAMAMKKLVVCPQVVGNVDFCIAGKTCLQPDFNKEAIFKSMVEALEMPEDQQQKMIDAGKEITANHAINRERESLINLLHQADEIWKDNSLFKKR